MRCTAPRAGLFSGLALVAGLPFVAGSPAAALSPPPPRREVRDNEGREFWLTFPTNYFEAPELTLSLASRVPTTATVSVGSASQQVSVVPGQITTVALPGSAQLAGTTVSPAVHVTAADEVAVYGLNRIQFTTDAFLGLPVDALGTRYRVLGYPDTIGFPSSAAIVATQDGTTVTVVPSAASSIGPAGTPATKVLQRGEAFQVRASGADLSGTLITADKAIAVFGANECTVVPFGTVACDHVVEQLPSTDAWGQSFVTQPLASRTGGDTFRLVADQDGTEVTIDAEPPVTLAAGQVLERLLGPTGHRITATKPVLLAQYSNSSSVDGVTSDPFMAIVPPAEQFQTSYTVTTPASGFARNYINVVVPTGSAGAVVLDGAPVPAASFAAIGGGFSGAALPVALGSHTLSAGGVPFGVTAYGFDEYDSYGYPGGLALGQVAAVSRLLLSPGSGTTTVGGQACTTASVQDQQGAGLEGVRVDFTVAGANPTSGSVVTDRTGASGICWAASALGTDVLTASTGSLTATARHEVVPPTSTTLPPVVVPPPAPGRVELGPRAIDVTRWNVYAPTTFLIDLQPSVGANKHVALQLRTQRKARRRAERFATLGHAQLDAFGDGRTTFRRHPRKFDMYRVVDTATGAELYRFQLLHRPIPGTAR